MAQNIQGALAAVNEATTQDVLDAKVTEITASIKGLPDNLKAGLDMSDLEAKVAERKEHIANAATVAEDIQNALATVNEATTQDVLDATVTEITASIKVPDNLQAG